MYRQTSTIEKSRLMMKFLFSSSISKQHSFENYLIRVFVLIFCCIISYRCSQIFATKSHDTLHKTFFLLSWKNRSFRTCRKISFRWIWRRDNHLRRFSLNFKLEKYWWNHILSNIWSKFEISFFHFFFDAFIFLKSENILQLNISKWTISFRINSFSKFCMKINDESQLNNDDDVRFNMCATTR